MVKHRKKVELPSLSRQYPSLDRCLGSLQNGRHLPVPGSLATRQTLHSVGNGFPCVCVLQPSMKFKVTDMLTKINIYLSQINSRTKKNHVWKTVKFSWCIAVLRPYCYHVKEFLINFFDNILTSFGECFAGLRKVKKWNCQVPRLFSNSCFLRLPNFLHFDRRMRHLRFLTTF